MANACGSVVFPHRCSSLLALESVCPRCGQAAVGCSLQQRSESGNCRRALQICNGDLLLLLVDVDHRHRLHLPCILVAVMGGRSMAEVREVRPRQTVSDGPATLRVCIQQVAEPNRQSETVEPAVLPLLGPWPLLASSTWRAWLAFSPFPR